MDNNFDIQNLVNTKYEGHFDSFVADMKERYVEAEFRLKKSKIDNTNRAILVNLENVNKSYKMGGQKLEVLKNINLNVYEGEMLAVVGPSGSGKSTLMHIIAGLDKADAGKVQVAGNILKNLSDNKLSRFRNATIGFVFQMFFLQPYLNVFENVKTPLYFGNPNKISDDHVREIISMVGLKDRIFHKPRELSGGQMQRVAVARALAAKPKLLIADEPTANVDKANSETIIKLFKEIAKTGTTVIVVTHDENVAMKCDRVVQMRDGELHD